MTILLTAVAVAMVIGSGVALAKTIRCDGGNRFGTNRADFIFAKNGGDFVSGRGRNDNLDGQDGNDLVLSGWGDDWVKGGRHDDTVKGDEAGYAAQREHDVVSDARKELKEVSLHVGRWP